MASNSKINKARSRVGVAARQGASREVLADLREELATVKVEASIEALVASWPKLSDERRARLADLLVAGGAR